MIANAVQARSDRSPEYLIYIAQLFLCLFFLYKGSQHIISSSDNKIRLKFRVKIVYHSRELRSCLARKLMGVFFLASVFPIGDETNFQSFGFGLNHWEHNHNQY